MIRPHDLHHDHGLDQRPDHEALWDRLGDRERRAIEGRFIENMGGDLICDIDEARASGTPERFAQLGRALASSWIEYRNDRLDALVAEGTLQ
jgi:hypothetical protein